MAEQYRLWLVDFDSAMNFEEGMYILQSHKEPTEEECVRAVYKNTYTGAIYYNGVKEIFEKDMRDFEGRKTLMSKE